VPAKMCWCVHYAEMCGQICHKLLVENVSHQDIRMWENATWLNICTCLWPH